MSWYGDPDELDRLATSLAASAERVHDRASAVRASTATTRWRGPAADAFHASVARESKLLERAAAELDDAAAAFHRHADAVRTEIARLLAVERAAQHVVSEGLHRVEHGVERLVEGLLP